MIEIKRGETIQQAKEIAILAEKVWKHTYIPIIGESQVTYMLEKFQSKEVVWESIRTHSYEYRLAYIGAQLVGYLSFQCRKEDLFISKIYVDPEKQKQGIAKRLFAEVKKSPLIRLTVNKENTVAIQVYERLGFEKEEAVIADIGSGYVMDDYVMVRRQEAVSTN